MFAVWVATTMLSLPLNAETTPVGQDGFLRARQVTVGILAETQDQRMPEKPGKVVIRGTGVHLRDGYVVTRDIPWRNRELQQVPSFRNGYTYSRMTSMNFLPIL